ncbi:MAG: transketolase [Nitrospinota bacterium]|nr:transketolase [Nitrospinota bacterium]
MKFTNDPVELGKIAQRMRIDILKMLNASGSGHSGGSLSCIDILVALYFSKLDHAKGRKKADKGDKFVLSKGHAAPALYAVLAEWGYFSKDELPRLRKLKSMLSGHPYSVSTPGVEVTTGSLGQGLSQANGLAIASRLNNHDSKIFCLLGDGENQEGQVWEAAMTASHYKLDNLIAIIDNNLLQIDGKVEDVMKIEPLAEKWASFGWNVLETDGHHFPSILEAIDNAKGVKGKPTVIIARTVKGKGVSFMEGNVKWHGATPNDEELKKAIEELS